MKKANTVVTLFLIVLGVFLFFVFLGEFYEGITGAQTSGQVQVGVGEMSGISLVSGFNSINFGTRSPGESISTAVVADSIKPFVVRNDGNVDVDVSVYASNNLWTSSNVLPSDFQFSVRARAMIADSDLSGVDNCYPPGGSPECYGSSSTQYPTWTSIPTTNNPLNAVLALGRLHYQNTNDEALVEISIKVPSDEPVTGTKISTVTLVGTASI